MLRTGFFGLVATAILFSACSGDIGDSSAGAGRGGPTPELGGNDPAEPLDLMAQEDPACPGAAAVLSTRNGWAGAKAAEPAFDTLDFELMVRPEAGNMDALVAVANQNVTDFSDAAILVRFAEDGLIDARDGSGYSRDVPVAYEADAWYSILISADVANRTYDVEVGRCGETRKALITNAAFRSDAPTNDELTTWAAWSSQDAALDVATPSWLAAGSCAPATCESLDLGCGTLSDGCGGTLNCGVCQGDQVCVVGGICVAPEPSPTPEPTPPPSSPPPPPGAEESAKPTAANTGCNASPYPSEDCDDIPGVPDTDCSDITEAYVTANCPGRICSNFYCKGGVLDIDTSNVTLRNFKHDADGSLYAIRINEGVSNTVIEYGEVWNGDSTVVYDKSNNLLFRYNYLHHSESDFIKADGTNGIYEYNFWEKGGSGEGTHADGVQTEPSSDNNEFRYNNCSMPKPGTPLHDAYPQDTNPPYFSPGPSYRSNACFIIQGSNTWIHHNWMTGGNYTIYGNTTTLVEYNIFGRENGDHPSLDTCTLCTGRARLCNGPFQDWRGNIWEDNGLSAGEGEEDGGTPCD